MRPREPRCPDYVASPRPEAPSRRHRRPLPLRALRHFVASGQHSSFTGAALDLSVSAQAVGQQVRLLERWLGCPLFDRVRGGDLAFTPVGLALYGELAPAIDLIEDAVERHVRGRHSRQLTVAATPAFATLWLMQRLGASRSGTRPPAVRVFATANPVGALANGADCAIFFAGDAPMGAVAQPFMTEAIVPVCAPGQRKPYPLLHDDSPDRDPILGCWTNWRETTSDLETTDGPRFGDAVLGLAAAQAGLGVWLARARLAAEALNAGRLAYAFGTARQSSCAWRLGATSAAAPGAVTALRHWLMAEAAADGEWPC
jgi:LysR family transcriptional regulator, glycine cleavage system transcriptional activator